MRRIGIDPGQRRTGLAICDEGVSLAMPLRTVEHGGFEQAVTRVAEAIDGEQPAEVVVGLPLRMDGSEGQAAKRVRRFVEALAKRIEVPIMLWDERLSTVAAERALSAQGVDGRKQRRVIDQAAAAIVLQSYIDAKAERCQVDPIDDEATPQAPPSSWRSPGRQGTGSSPEGRGTRRQNPKGRRGGR